MSSALTIILIFDSSMLINAFGEFGDICNNTDECSDHRFACVPDEFNISRCICDRFHKWLNISLGCMQIINDSFIINSTVTEERNNEEVLEKYNKAIFSIQLAAGIFVLAFVVFATCVVIVYCLYIRQTDRSQQNSFKLYKHSSRAQPSSSRY